MAAAVGVASGATPPMATVQMTSASAPPPYSAWDQQITQMTSRLGVQPEHVDQAKRAVYEQVKTMRPWYQFVRFGAFSRPLTFAEGQQRLLYNLSYYRSNYILIFLGLTAYILITNLLLLVSLAAIAAIYVVTMRISGESVRVGPVTISRQQFNLILAIASILLLYLSSAGSSLGYLVLLSSALIAGHAILAEMVPPEAEFV